MDHLKYVNIHFFKKKDLWEKTTAWRNILVLVFGEGHEIFPYSLKNNVSFVVFFFFSIDVANQCKLYMTEKLKNDVSHSLSLHLYVTFILVCSNCDL